MRYGQSEPEIIARRDPLSAALGEEQTAGGVSAQGKRAGEQQELPPALFAATLGRLIHNLCHSFSL